MLMPPPPNHGDYYITLGLEWGMNFENTKIWQRAWNYSAY